MTKILRYSVFFGSPTLALLFVGGVWRIKHQAHGEQVKAEKLDPNGLQWKQLPRTGQESGPTRIALYRGTRNCGYIEDLRPGISPRFLVFVVPRHSVTTTQSFGQPPGNGFLLAGFDSLESAKQREEQICATEK